jgi:hypothetical protein
MDAKPDVSTEPDVDAEPHRSTEPGAAPQPTGDHAVDEALAQLEKAADAPLDIQIEVGERVLRVLQDRLADLGPE